MARMKLNYSNAMFLDNKLIQEIPRIMTEKKEARQS
jgi:hypothetical protein